MARGTALVATLKRALKAKGLTYAQVAGRLGVSETSVKRTFTSQGFTLERLDRVCELLEMDLSELVHLAEEERERIHSLTQEQEQELVSDIKLLLVAVCVRSNWTFPDIVAHYAISEPECVRLLVRLDRLKLIDLLPGNRVKLRVAPDFRWLPGGPIERFVDEHVEDEFLESAFDRSREAKIFLTGRLTPASHETLLKKLRALAHDFADLHREDSRLPIGQRHDLGILMALRPWEPPGFTALRRRG